MSKEDAASHTAELARIKELVAATAASPKDQALWIELGNLYFDTHQAKLSIVAYETALGLGKASADVWTDLGIMQREAGEPKKALNSFDAALAINPRHENALYNKGVVQLHDTADKAGAAATWEKLVGINPGAKTPEGKPLLDILTELKRG
jgi:tetratricopeptide (TPR) repeat protein